MSNILYLGCSDKGGVSVYVSNLIKNQKDFNYFIPSANKDLNYRIEQLYNIDKKNIINFDQYYGYKSVLKKAKELHKIIIKNNIDIIHAHVLRFGLLAAMYKKLYNPKIKLIYTGHGSRYLQKEDKLAQLVFKYIEKFVNSTADKVIFIRKLEYNLSLDSNLITNNKGIYLPTQIKIEQKQSNDIYSLKKTLNIEDKKIIAMVGSMYDIKQPYLFCKIAKEYHKTNKDTVFVWVGSGEMYNEIKEYIKLSNQEHLIKLVGNVEYEKMYSIWQELDVLLLTSKIEIFPLIVLEAYLTNTLVISSNFLGVDEVISNNETGFIFDMNNPKEAVNILLDNKNNFYEIKVNAQKHYRENFEDVNNMQQKHSKIYKEVINDNN